MTRQLPAVLSLLVLSAGSLAAQQAAPALKEDKPGLAAQATVSADSALHIARLRVPRGTVAAREIEEEDGKLIYSFDMKVPGRTGIDEVNVNARTGAVVGVEHESPATETRERGSDARKSAPPATH